jgi:CBS domain-containing protein/glycosyltransferase involved in cell wall biosynthesis
MLPVISGTNLDTPTANPKDNVSKIIEKLVEKNIGAIVVTEDNRPVGIITESDILEKVLSRKRDPNTTKIHEIMSSPVISVESDDSVKNAIEVMEKFKIRRLVVTQGEVFLGITTERRLLNIAHKIYLENTEGKLEPTTILHDKPIITYLSSYPPRECGIATFTQSLVEAIDKLETLSPPIISAINDKGGFYNYPPQVQIQIEREEPESYIKAAQKINDSNIQSLNMQHEFGLFGGDWGDYLLDFLEEVEKPIITTFHTILEKPNKKAQNVMKEIINHSYRVVVLARIGTRILEETYDTLPDKVRHIPHGCPNLPFINSETMKNVLGLNNKTILSSFGLISRGKGIEYAINALPSIIEKEPKTLFLVIGETHPEVRKYEGESYRNTLIDLAESLGVEKNIRFINRFLPKNELISYLQATDIYILPYPNPEQISSGTMLYALCTGKAIVTTPFLHAQEVIAQGAALDCEFKDPESIAWAVKAFIGSRELLTLFERRAYEYSRDMIWPNVAMQYVNLFYESIGM